LFRITGACAADTVNNTCSSGGVFASSVRLIREEITQAIAAVEDYDMQAILVRHYLAYETFELIAEKMHYDLRTIQRKHKRALDEVVIECHPESVV
jgi:hypothetical protein